MIQLKQRKFSIFLGAALLLCGLTMSSAKASFENDENVNTYRTTQDEMRLIFNNTAEEFDFLREKSNTFKQTLFENIYNSMSPNNIAEIPENFMINKLNSCVLLREFHEEEWPQRLENSPIIPTLVLLHSEYIDDEYDDLIEDFSSNFTPHATLVINE